MRGDVGLAAVGVAGDDPQLLAAVHVEDALAGSTRMRLDGRLVTTRMTMSVTLRAARAHARERRMARGVEEGDRALAVFTLVGADVLRDAAGFARRDPSVLRM